MGEAKRRFDYLDEKITALKESQEKIFKIQKEQAIIMSVLIKKMEVTQDDIKKETDELNAQLKENKRNLESSKIQS